MSDFDSPATNQVNILDLGAKGDGITDDTLAIQEALDNYQDLYFPSGTYIVTNLVVSKSNVTIKGDGIGKTKFVYSGEPFTEATKGILIAKGQSNINNLQFEGFTIDGLVQDLGFEEHSHNLYLLGVDDAVISNCEFKGFRGDGIYLGGVDMPSQIVIKYNDNITITDCVFDGVNKDNRNGISVISGTNITIKNSYFKNCSRDDMPSAIDFEPDHQEQLVRDCLVDNCTFDSIGGNAGVVGIFFVKGKKNENNVNFKFSNNSFKNCALNTPVFFASINNRGEEMSPNECNINVTIEDNDVANCGKLFEFSNVNDVALINNTFVDCKGSGYISYYVNQYSKSYNLFFSRNTFNKCGTINVFSVDGLIFENNKFLDSIVTGINFTNIEPYNITSYNVILSQNIFSSPTKSMTYAVKVSNNHDLDPLTNDSYLNELDEGMRYEFVYADLEYFGAVGDGVTDDTEAMLMAFNHAIQTRNNHLHIPEGTYLVTRGFNLTDGFHVYGDGDKSLIKLETNLPPRTSNITQGAILMGTPQTNDVGYPNSDLPNKGILIENLSIDTQRPADNLDATGNSFPMMGGILIYNAVNCTIKNVKISNPWIWGISISCNYDSTEDVTNNTIEDCKVELTPNWYDTPNNPRWKPPLIGIQLTSYVKNYGATNNGALNNLTRDNEDYLPSRVYGNTIKNCYISNGSHGISLSNVKQNNIIGNQIKGCSNRGIIMTSTSDENIISENRVSDIGSTGIHLAYNCNSNQILKNNVSNITCCEGDGIKTYINCNYNVIKENVVTNFAVTGIRVAHVADNNVISDNKINGGSSNRSGKYGIKILSNSYNQYYVDQLTYNDELTAKDNVCELNTISNVETPIKVGDEVIRSTPIDNVNGNIVKDNVYVGDVAPKVETVDSRTKYYVIGGILVTALLFHFITKKKD